MGRKAHDNKSVKGVRRSERAPRNNTDWLGGVEGTAQSWGARRTKRRTKEDTLGEKAQQPSRKGLERGGNSQRPENPKRGKNDGVREMGCCRLARGPTREKRGGGVKGLEGGGGKFESSAAGAAPRKEFYKRKKGPRKWKGGRTSPVELTSKPCTENPRVSKETGGTGPVERRPQKSNRLERRGVLAKNPKTEKSAGYSKSGGGGKKKKEHRDRNVLLTAANHPAP